MAFTPGQNSLEVEVSSTGVGQFRGAMGRASDALLSFRGAALLAGGAMAALGTAVIAETITQAREWNAVIRELTKVTDPMAAERIGAQMVELSQVIPLPTEQLGDLATQAARFGVAEENIEAFVSTVAKMAVATNVTVDEAGQAFARLSKLTDTPIDQIENLGSAINLLGQTTATSAADIVNGMLRSSAALRAIGLEAPEISGLNAAIIEVSESAERAGTRLRRLAQELADPRKLSEIAVGFASIDGSVINMTQSVQDQQAAVGRANQRLEEERMILQGLKGAMAETTAELRGLGDAHDELGDSIADNRIKIQEIRLAARKEGRELTESEKQDIEELQLANDELRLEQMKTARQMDDLQEKREEQSEAVDEQQSAVEDAAAALQSEQSALEDVAVEELERMFEEDPAGAILELSEAMAEGGKESDVLRENLSAVSIQALSAIGENDAAIDILERSSDAFREATSLSREFEIEAHSVSSEMERLTNAMENFAAPVGNVFIPFVKDAIVGLTGLFEGMRKFTEAGNEGVVAAGLVATVLGGLALVIAAVAPAIGGLVTGLVGSGGLAAALTLLTGPIGLAIAAVALLAGAWATNFGGIRDITANVMGRIRELWERHGEALFGPGGEVRQTLEPLLDFWEEWGDEIIGATQFVWSVVAGIFGFAFDALGGILTTGLDALLTVFRIGLAILRGDWEHAFLLMGDFFIRMLNGILDFAAEWGGKLINAIIGALPKELRGRIRDALGLGEEGGFEAPQIRNPYGELLAQRRGAEELAAQQAAVAARPMEFTSSGFRAAQNRGEVVQREEVTIREEVVISGGDAVGDQIAANIERERRARDRTEGKPDT